MDGNSGQPSKQMKIWMANKKAQIKRQIIKEENARLKHENEIMRAVNHEMRQMLTRNPCTICKLKTKNARLAAEYERLQAIAAMRMAKSNPKPDLGSSSSMLQNSGDKNATASKPDTGASAHQDEPSSF